MGRRSSFERNPRDYYPTPYEAILPLLKHISVKEFIEPCAGDGRLIRHLQDNGFVCTYSCDIEPRAEKIEQKDVLFFGSELPPAQQIITNPPWGREVLHPMIDKFRNHAPTWLLFDAGWMFTGQAKPYLKFCSTIVSVGRAKWIEGSDGKGKDDCCWYKFQNHEVRTIFIA